LEVESNKRETPHPSVLGGEKGDGVKASQDTTGVPIDYRARRMATQRAIALICRADALANYPGEFPGDVYRVVQCLWCRVDDVQVVRSIEHNRAHYKGLQTCGSVWVCPCCAAKVEERRRLEILQVFEWAKREGFDASMHTNTFSHGQGDNLRDLFDKQAKALKLFRNHSAYCKTMKAIGFVSMVRALEITHGQNGWHPHTHEVKFHREKLSASDAESIRQKLVEPWMQSCTTAGLFDPVTSDAEAFRLRSLDIKHGFTAGDYLAKTDDKKNWTPAHEVAKASSKQGRRSGLHPFQLAVRSNPGDNELFLEYVKATKGKRKLVFSPGLKKNAGIAELTDEQIAAKELDNSLKIATLPPVIWEFIKSKDLRSRVLDAAESGGKTAIIELLHFQGFDPFS
jgi:hypothetical protein